MTPRARAVALAGIATALVATPRATIRRWKSNPDPTKGAPLDLPAGFNPSYARVAGAVVASQRVDQALRRPILGPILLRGSVGRAPSMAHLLAIRESFLATPPETRRGFLEDMAVIDLRPELASLTTATLVVSGTRDTLLAHRLSRALASAIPGAELVAIPGAGHQLPFEAPDCLAEILLGAAPRHH